METGSPAGCPGNSLALAASLKIAGKEDPPSAGVGGSRWTVSTAVSLCAGDTDVCLRTGIARGEGLMTPEGLGLYASEDRAARGRETQRHCDVCVKYLCPGGGLWKTDGSLWKTKHSDGVCRRGSLTGLHSSFLLLLLWSASFRKPVVKLPNLDSLQWGKMKCR